jgi:hypothetical protein
MYYFNIFLLFLLEEEEVEVSLFVRSTLFINFIVCFVMDIIGLFVFRSFFFFLILLITIIFTMITIIIITNIIIINTSPELCESVPVVRRRVCDPRRRASFQRKQI